VTLLTWVPSQKYAKIKSRDKELFERGGATTPLGGKSTAKAASASAKRLSKDSVKKNYSEESEDDEEIINSPSKKAKTFKEEVSEGPRSAMEDE
jgi:hypothetical protein